MGSRLTVIVRPGELIVYGALNIDCAAKEVATYKAAVKAKHKKGLRILNGESPWI